MFDNNAFVVATNGGLWRLNPDLSRSLLCQLNSSTVSDIDVQNEWVAWGRRSANELLQRSRQAPDIELLIRRFRVRIPRAHRKDVTFALGRQRTGHAIRGRPVGRPRIALCTL